MFRTCDKNWNVIETCLENEFTHMCYGRQNCEHTKAKDPWCFVLPFWIDITYNCVEGKASFYFLNPIRSTWKLAVNIICINLRSSLLEI